MTLLIVNFGGPRSLTEIRPFLQALLTDQDVVRTGLPKVVHNPLFSTIAWRRSKKIAGDYASIGGKSPIYDDTEAVAQALREKTGRRVLTFHRYLPETHPNFIDEVQQIEGPIDVFPMFPQFTYATTGSIARWFDKKLPLKTLNQMRWVKSYPRHPAFVKAFQGTIQDHLNEKGLKSEECVLLFSAHGIPKKFVLNGDIYRRECEESFEAIMKGFPEALGRLAFQSKFGPGEWLRPYTVDVCEEIREWNEGRKTVVFVPLAFTSDHIETLFEIEDEYMPIIRKEGLRATRVPALNRRTDWIEAIPQILNDANSVHTDMLIRRR